jgi:4-amino-4-deoxy-L-arabinose transferase-like glycosyltransferase
MLRSRSALMTSSLKPITSKLSRFWFDHLELCVAATYAIVFSLHGATIGLSDDEAYYWVLSRKLALGYAYHPPMVAWLIAAFSFLGASSFAVRLPGTLCVAGVLYLSLRWLRSVGVSRLGRAAAILFSFAGLFALSWMMVPDLPLILGFTLAFVSTWKILFQNGRNWFALIFALALCVLSKYSGVAVAASAFLCLWIWAPVPRTSFRLKSLLATGLGVLLAAIPIVIWNSQHEWTSILYQIHDRHEGGSLSLARYARFWAIELFAAGPVLIGFIFWLMARGHRARVLSFVFFWIFPAALVFCVEPIWADFKPHWAFIVWWPGAMALAWAACTWTKPALARAAKVQIVYGWVLGALVLFACHFPIGGYFTHDPRMDVTNDLYGWKLLRGALGGANLPVVASHYQTAAQAYFSLGPGARVTLLPRDLKARDEWPSLDVSQSEGPAWPRLTQPVLFVRDNRYSAMPEYPGASCSLYKHIDEARRGFPAKWIEAWKCTP